jgi:hypothetical protein
MNDKPKSSVEIVTTIVSLTLVVVTFIGSIAYYNIKDRQLMAQNIETAIAKGIDPLAVRCSYAVGSDTVCVAYAASHGTTSFSTPSKK